MKKLFQNAFYAIKNYFSSTSKLALHFVRISLELIIACFLAQFVYINALFKVSDLSLFGLVETAKSLDESLVLSLFVALILGILCNRTIKEQNSK